MTRNGVARGIVVVPEFPAVLSIAIAGVTVSVLLSRKFVRNHSRGLANGLPWYPQDFMIEFLRRCTKSSQILALHRWRLCWISVVLKWDRTTLRPRCKTGSATRSASILKVGVAGSSYRKRSSIWTAKTPSLHTWSPP